MSIEDDWHGLKFGVRRSVRYHNRRRAFFDRLDKITNMVSVIFGSAAVFGVMDVNFKTLALTAAAMVTVTSAVNLVLGSSLRARDHADFARRFIALEKEMEIHAPIAETLKRLTAQRLDIESDEPPIMRVLDCLCHNEQMRAQGYSPEQFAKIRWWQSLFAQIVDLREDLIKA